MITVVVTGAAEVAARYAALRTRHVRAAEAAFQAAAPRLVQRAQAETPEGRGETPGRLRQGWQTSVSGAELSLHNATPYAGIVVRGRGPIMATRGRALRFVINGQVFFRRRVGPAAPNPFDARVRASVVQEAPAIGLDIVLRMR